MKRSHAIGFVLAVLVALGLAGRSDQKAADLEFQRYCRMVALHERTGGEYGWPDYRELAKQCNEESEQ